MMLMSQEIDKLREQITAAGIEPSPPTNEYEALRVVRDRISIIVYKSGTIFADGNSIKLL